MFWSFEVEAELTVDSVPDAAGLVTEGRAAMYNHCISGVIAGGAELPVLGIFVLSDSIELDYRMGKEWGPRQVAGFFELLKDCCDLDANATVTPFSD
ncbi:hypothetical protein EP7_002130 [Isosphaeraceae bacterium EP7]